MSEASPDQRTAVPPLPAPLAQAVTGDRALVALTRPVMWKPRLPAKVTAQEKRLCFTFHSGLVWSSADEKMETSPLTTLSQSTFMPFYSSALRPSGLKMKNNVVSSVRRCSRVSDTLSLTHLG